MILLVDGMRRVWFGGGLARFVGFVEVRRGGLAVAEHLRGQVGLRLRLQLRHDGRGVHPVSLENIP